MRLRSVDIPFVYAVDYLPPRARKTREGFVMDQVTLKIRVLDEGEFPIALRASRGGLQRNSKVTDFRWDGATLSRVATEDGVDDNPEVGVGVLDELHLPGNSSPFRVAQGLMRFGPDTRPVQRADIPGQIQHDNRNEKLLELRSRASKTLIHADRIWIASAEPCYRLHAGSWSSGPYIGLDRAKPADIQQPETVIRADRLDRFKAIWFPTAAPEIFGHIDVLLPEALHLEPELPGLLNIAERALKSLETELPTATVDEFVRYAALRDALKSAAPGPVVLDAVKNIQASPQLMRAAAHLSLDKHAQLLADRLEAQAELVAEPERRGPQPG